MKTIVFSSIKGGTGKSSNAILLANYLAQGKKKVLCIDMDIQNSMTFYYAENAKTVERYSIAEALHQGDIEVNIIETGNDRINLVPSSFKLVNLRTISAMTLKRLLKAVSESYDYCIIDTAPTWDNINLNALYAADKIITPVQLTQWDWKGALFFRDQMLQDLDESYLKKWEILVSGWRDPRTDNPENYSNAVFDLFTESFDNILSVKIPALSLVKKYIDTGEKITRAKDKVKLFEAVRLLSHIITGVKMAVEVF